MATVKFSYGEQTKEVSVDLTEKAPYLSNFNEIREKKRELEEAELNNTIEIKFVPVPGKKIGDKTPKLLKDFTHRWTFQDVGTMEEFIKQKEETREHVRHHLAAYLGDKSADEIISDHKQNLVVTKPTGMEDWKEKKAKAKALGELEKDIDDIEEKRPRRTEEFGKDIREISKNIEEYEENLDKAEGNIKFEDNIKGSFKKGKSRTTGNLDWYDEKGEKHEFIIYDNSVTHAFYREGERETVEMSKSTAKNYYQENRIG